MKRYYLILVLTLATCMGFAGTATDNRDDRLSYISDRLNARKKIAKSDQTIVEKENVNSSSKSDKIIYGYCTYDDTWENNTSSGLYSFNTISLETIKKEWMDGREMISGTYHDGFIYAEVAESTENGEAFISLSFCKINVNNGEFTIIADWFPQAVACFSMTYDYSSNTLLGMINISPTSSRLHRIDMNTGKLTPIGGTSISKSFASTACSYDGTVYAIDDDGNLVTIDKKGKASTIGSTREVLRTSTDFPYYQSMTFDHSDGTLYWAVIDSKGESKFGVVNPKTGKFTSNGILGNNSQFVALYVPFDGIGVESAGEVQFDIYPNPVREAMNINGDFTEVSIYNHIGQCVGTYPSETTKIDVSNLPEGVYVVKVANGNACSTRKIMIRK